MATDFPAALDAFTNPTASDNLDSATVPHADQHADANDAIEALQAKVGVDDSAVTTSLDYKVNALLGTGSEKPATATFRIKSDGTPQVLNDDDGLWYTIGVKNVDGLPTWYLADTGEA